MKWFIMVLLFAGCTLGVNIGVVSYVPYLVEYRVYGTVPSALITFTNSGVFQQEKIKLPWTHSFYTNCSSVFLYFTAYHDYPGGELTTEIYINGIKKTQETKSGTFFELISEGVLSELLLR